MSTKTIKPTDSLTALGASPEALKTYREAVFSIDQSECPSKADLDEIIESAWRTRRDFGTDCKTYRQRVKARRDHDEKVPKLEAKVEELRRAMKNATPEKVGAKPLSEIKTVGELASVLETIRYGGDPVTYISAERHAWHEARSNLQSTEAEIRRVLMGTADPDIDSKIHSTRQTIQGIKARIVENEKLVNLPDQIKEAQRTLRSLASIPPGQIGAERKFQSVREQLHKLLKLQPQRPMALKQLDTDRAEIVRLEKEEKRLRQRKLDPKAMQWSRNLADTAGPGS